MSRNRPPETIAEQLIKRLGQLAFYAYLDKVETYFACWYDSALSHEANWQLAMAAIEAGWTPAKELNAKQSPHPGREAIPAPLPARSANLAGLATQLRNRWRLGL